VEHSQNNSRKTLKVGKKANTIDVLPRVEPIDCNRPQAHRIASTGKPSPKAKVQ
jgi:hypothetical protein